MIFRQFCRMAIRFYQVTFSAWLGPRCRFFPSCSQYALEALEEHGPAKGLALSLRRFGRCHPWGGSGYDPVPACQRCAQRHDA